MERHGQNGHVYSLPSSRHRAQSKASDQSSSSQPAQGKKYQAHHWHILSLKRCSPSARSAPNTPSREHPPVVSGQDHAASTAPSLLIVTLLHLPTAVLYAWPIALVGSTNGKCMVTQPYQSPSASHDFDPNAVLSESIKILADVIQAWIKTASMRESLRRKESRREKGARKLGQSEQDAVWINESLGLASISSETRMSALERAWKEDGDSTTPPTSSPAMSPRSEVVPDSSASNDAKKRSAGSNEPQRSSPVSSAGRSLPEVLTASSTPETISRPETPRIEISAPAYFGPTVDRPAIDAILSEQQRMDKQQKDVEQEISEWMHSASLSEFTRPRPAFATTGEGMMLPNTSQTSSSSTAPSSPTTRSASPSTPPILRTSSSSSVKTKLGGTKRVSFTDATSPTTGAAMTSAPDSPTSPSMSPLMPTAFRPVFAPNVALKSFEEEAALQQEVGLPPAMHPLETSSFLQPVSRSPTHSAPSSPRLEPEQDLSKTSIQPGLTVQSTVARPSAVKPSPTSPRMTHARSRTSSKLSQEVPREDILGAIDPATSRSRASSGSRVRTGAKSLSPVSSFGDFKNVFKGLKTTKPQKQQAS